MTLDEVADARCPGVAPHLVMSQTHQGRGDATIDDWVLGAGSWLMSMRYHGLAVSCPRTRRSDPSTRLLTIAVLDPGDWTLIRDGRPIVQETGRPTLVALDQMATFDFRGHGLGSALAVHITLARLTLSPETVCRGLDNVHPGLPLYPLALRHLRRLGDLASVSPDLLATVGTATIGLLRSLLINGADSARFIGAGDELVVKIEQYIENHLDRPDLGAEIIAAAHHISVRQLYKCWPDSHGGLARYIASRRLAQARTSLLTDQHLSIAAIAQKHGFAHPTHFTQRFRASYGVTPSQWRRRNEPLVGRH